MSLTTLRKDVSIGIEGLDREHARLVGVMQEIAANFEQHQARERVSGWFGELYVEALAHFALEEALMRDRNYAGYEAHKADHEQMLEELSLKMESFESGTCEDCGTSLGDCLAEWYTRHATEMDARLKDLVQ